MLLQILYTSRGVPGYSVDPVEQVLVRVALIAELERELSVHHEGLSRVVVHEQKLRYLGKVDSVEKTVNPCEQVIDFLGVGVVLLAGDFEDVVVARPRVQLLVHEGTLSQKLL